MSDNPEINGGDNSARVAREELRAFIERIERLEQEKKDLGVDVREVYAEAKGKGYDAKTIRKVVAERKKSADKRDEERAMFDLYCDALGVFG